jgi:hypothetical protein
MIMDISQSRPKFVYRKRQMQEGIGKSLFLQSEISRFAGKVNVVDNCT